MITIYIGINIYLIPMKTIKIKNTKFLTVAVIITLFTTMNLSVTSTIYEKNSIYVNISPEEANEMISYKNIVLIDVRTAEEYYNEHIHNSISIPLSELKCNSCLNSFIVTYNGDNVIVYSDDDVRGKKAYELLMNQGFDKVYILQCELSLWEKMGFESDINEKETKEFSNGHSENQESDWQLVSYDPLSSEKSLGCIYEPIKQGEKLPLTLYPPTWNWKNQGVMTGVRNQGGCGSCVAFGVLGSFEAVIKINSGQTVDLSEADLFYCGCGACCGSGWYSSSAVNYIYSQGVPDEACFPYHDYNMDCDPCEDREDRIVKPSNYGYLTSASSIKSAIFNYGPVITSFAVYEDFHNEYTGGIYHYSHGDLDGYHCVAVVGYNDNDNYWICKNSWGSSWGESGYFRIGYGEVGICGSAYYLDYEVPHLTVNAGGPYVGRPTKSINFYGTTTGGDPPYIWHWDFGDGITSDMQNPIHAYSATGTYTITLTVIDNEDETDEDITTAEITLAPDIPKKPSGLTSGYPNNQYTYSTVTKDPTNANVRYGWDWNGDGLVDEWTSYYPSGTPVNVNHSFRYPGEYRVKVKAKNTFGEKSSFSPALTVFISETNSPPYMPSDPNPEDDAVDISLNIDLSWSCGDPDPGDTTTYDMYFGTTNPPPKVSTNQSTNVYVPGKLDPGTNYFWKIIAWDTHQASTEGSLWRFTTEGQPNNPPNAPQIDGISSGKMSATYLYTFVSTDPDVDHLYYYIDWNDGNITDWFGPFDSNEEVGVTHTWTTQGTYIIKAKVKDMYAESDWGTMEVTMSKNKQLNNLQILNFLDHLISYFPLLSRLLTLYSI